MGTHKTYTQEFKRDVVLRMKTCPNIPKLAQELGLYKNQLYKWRLEQERMLEQEGAYDGMVPPRQLRAEAGLKAENRQLKEALAQKVLQVDFFKGALRRVKAASRNQESGGPAFMPKSGPERSSKAD